ncbi:MULTISPECIES: hypothetical protein [Bacillaceae]|uniref:Uncharacterized protein n=1 Tax=Evansella alkalicola TaxID=745819 RepID=A0ABS6JY61_9BACI|nr:MULTISPECIES: hypothetical protein [Bacillaceae]MBU9723536.1 hypothetical protein [Bacillus alkalicola]
MNDTLVLKSPFRRTFMLAILASFFLTIFVISVGQGISLNADNLVPVIAGAMITGIVLLLFFNSVIARVKISQYEIELQTLFRKKKVQIQEIAEASFSQRSNGNNRSTITYKLSDKNNRELMSIKPYFIPTIDDKRRFFHTLYTLNNNIYFCPVLTDILNGKNVSHLSLKEVSKYVVSQLSTLAMRFSKEDCIKILENQYEGTKIINEKVISPAMTEVTFTYNNKPFHFFYKTESDGEIVILSEGMLISDQNETK